MHKDIKEKMQSAMKEKDLTRLSVMRGILAELTNEAVKLGKKPDTELPDEAVVRVISRLAKQRKDSIEQYEKGNREDLANEEKSELKILEEFLPEQMSEDEVRATVRKTIDELADSDSPQMGQIMSSVMGELQGMADGSMVKRIVSEELGS